MNFAARLQLQRRQLLWLVGDDAGGHALWLREERVRDAIIADELESGAGLGALLWPPAPSRVPPSSIAWDVL
jgi:hypothetical protein